MMSMKIIAFALRRSGSTAFWQIFNSSARFLTLDEPCNPLLRRLPKPHHKETLGSFIELYNRSPDKFREMFAPILKNEELTEEFSAANEDYFKFLVQNRTHWFMDVTRCHLKVNGLAELFRDAMAIHLFRNPTGFVTSHMLPSYGGVRARTQRFLNKHFFWSRQSGFNMWSVERIFDNWFHLAVKYFPSLEIPEAAITVRKSHEKLLLYWLFHFRFMEMKGRLAFGERFYSLCFDDLCMHPESVLEGVLGDSLDMAEFDISHLKPAKHGFGAGSPNWAVAMKKVGFTEEEINRWLR